MVYSFGHKARGGNLGGLGDGPPKV